MAIETALTFRLLLHLALRQTEGAYERHLDADQHRVGKDKTQKIESKHINCGANANESGEPVE